MHLAAMPSDVERYIQGILELMVVVLPEDLGFGAEGPVSLAKGKQRLNSL